MPERVLAVPTDALGAITARRGFVEEERLFGALALGRFLERDEAEHDETHRQVIPYVVFRSTEGVFSYARTTRGGEARLHRLRSIGVGGHVTPEDLPDGLAGLAASPRAALVGAARREIAEETVGLEDAVLRPVGFIFDDGAAVSRVHLGLVLLSDVGGREVRLSDEGKMAEARHDPIERLRAERDAYEGWSQLVIDWLAEDGER